MESCFIRCSGHVGIPVEAPCPYKSTQEITTLRPPEQKKDIDLRLRKPRGTTPNRMIDWMYIWALTNTEKVTVMMSNGRPAVAVKIDGFQKAWKYRVMGVGARVLSAAMEMRKGYLWAELYIYSVQDWSRSWICIANGARIDSRYGRRKCWVAYLSETKKLKGASNSQWVILCIWCFSRLKCKVARSERAFNSVVVPGWFVCEMECPRRTHWCQSMRRFLRSDTYYQW